MMMERQDVIPLVGHSWAHCLSTIEPRLDARLRSAISGSVPLKTDGRKLVIGVHGQFSRDLLNRPLSREEIVAKLPLMESHKVELEFVTLDGEEPTTVSPAPVASSPAADHEIEHDRDYRPTRASGNSTPLNPRDRKSVV